MPSDRTLSEESRQRILAAGNHLTAEEANQLHAWWKAMCAARPLKGRQARVALMFTGAMEEPGCVRIDDLSLLLELTGVHHSVATIALQKLTEAGYLRFDGEAYWPSFSEEEVQP